MTDHNRAVIYTRRRLRRSPQEQAADHTAKFGGTTTMSAPDTKPQDRGDIR